MIKKIELDGKKVKIEFIMPEEIKKFLKKNNIDETRLLNDYRWEKCIYEDLLDENYRVKNKFTDAKLVINYIHFSQDNKIRVPSEKLVAGDCIGGGNWNKGSFFEEFSIGYSIFTE